MLKFRKLFSLIVFILFITFALSSCKMKAEQKSLTLYFEVIDSYIADGDFKAAIKELKRTEKIAYDSWSYLGLYKRYDQMGEKKKAEKLLKRALKKNPHNEELVAVYANFLMRNGKTTEAAKKAEELRGTKYGSIYSEAVLYIEKEKVNPSENPEYYKDPRFYEIYYDAYKAGYDTYWMRNCAVYHLSKGNYANAAAISPKHFSDADDAYFWAMVLFDGGRYYDAADAVQTSRTFIEKSPHLRSGNKEHPSSITLSALESDAYIAVSEVEKAAEARSHITKNLTDLENINAQYKKLTNEENKLLQTITTNSIIYANNVDDTEQSYNLLNYAVDRWPTFVDALSLYADFAFRSNIERKETLEEQNLRKLGLKSLEMEKFDKRKVISFEDAFNLLDSALQKENEPLLSILKMDLKYKIDENLSQKQKTSELYYMLEKNYTSEVKYHSLLVQYTLNYLLLTKQYDDAYSLFYNYIVNTYNFDRANDFWSQLKTVMTKLDIKMAEFAAFFAARQGLYNETFAFYEYCVFEKTPDSEVGLVDIDYLDDDDFISPYVSTASCMNLADAYFSINKFDNAITLYSKAIGRESSNYLRCIMHCRLAQIYIKKGDQKNASRALDYANQIYPGNALASLLKDKITQ